MRSASRSCLLAAALTAVACASRPTLRLDPDLLVPGRTEAALLDALGPAHARELLDAGWPVTVLTWRPAQGALAIGDQAATALAVELRAGVVTASRLLGTRAPPWAIDWRSVELLLPGLATCEQLRQLLGPPSATGACPSVLLACTEPGGVALAWEHGSYRLQASCDADALLLDCRLEPPGWLPPALDHSPCPEPNRP